MVHKEHSMAKNSAKQKSSKAKATGDKQRKASSQKYTSTSSKEAPPARVRKRKRKVRLLPLTPNQIVQPVPETTLTRRGVSLKKLYRNTPELYKANGADVDIVTMKKAKTATGLPAVRAVCVHNDSIRVDRVKKPRNVVILGFEKDVPLSKQKKVLVSCSCENFVFTWEYANAHHGAAKIIYGNGDAPNYTNPRLAVGLCKHLVAVTLELFDKGK